jgi:glycerate 2-kinase
MKIVIAPDSFKESLTAMEVATCIENGLRQVLPMADIVKVPMADGGEGTVQSLIDASDGEWVYQQVIGPLGTTVEAYFGVMGAGQTAVIEMASASGIHLVPSDRRDPLVTTSYGTGQLILAALDKGVTHIILGIGGSATNDGGLGMCQALGGQFLDKNGQELVFGGGALDKLVSVDLSQLDSRLADITIEVACDVDNPLCGPSGASYVFGPQKGATPAIAQLLDDNLSHFAEVVGNAVGKDIKNVPGSGAAGGLGAALYGIFGADLRSGVDIVIEATGLKALAIDADLIITGEGRIDSQTIHGKTPIGVARVAKDLGIPVIGIAGCLANDCAIVHQYGIDAVFSVVPHAIDLDTALKHARVNVENTARNIAAVIHMFS